jgi:hypothetical protein
VRGDEPAPSGDQRQLTRRFGVVDATEERHLQPIDLVAELGQHRNEERVGDQDGRQHAERRPDAQLRDEVKPEEGESRDGDRDGHAGEEDGTAR